MPLTVNRPSYFVIIVRSLHRTVSIPRSQEIQQVAFRIWDSVVWTALPNSFTYLGIYTYWAILSMYTSAFCFGLALN